MKKNILTDINIIKKTGTAYLGKYADHFLLTDSTNNEIRRQCNNKPEGYTVIADEQTSGKGRLGRSWCSEKYSGIYMSILLKPNISPILVPQITLISGLAVCTCLREIANCDNIMIKWPNDVILGSKKLCGILCETQISENSTPNVIVGIGINVNQKNFPDEIAFKAGSLYSETGKTFDKTKIICTLLENLEMYYEKYKKYGFSSVASEYKSRCVSLNREIHFSKNGTEIVAEAKDILDNGNLLALGNNGTKYQISSGEVVVQGIY